MSTVTLGRGSNLKLHCNLHSPTGVSANKHVGVGSVSGKARRAGGHDRHHNQHIWRGVYVDKDIPGGCYDLDHTEICGRHFL